jgi:hypothetical protein
LTVQTEWRPPGVGPVGRLDKETTMKRVLIALAAAGLVAGSLPASADEALFKAKGCAIGAK